MDLSEKLKLARETADPKWGPVLDEWVNRQCGDDSTSLYLTWMRYRVHHPGTLHLTHLLDLITTSERPAPAVPGPEIVQTAKDVQAALNASDVPVIAVLNDAGVLAEFILQLAGTT